MKSKMSTDSKIKRDRMNMDCRSGANELFAKDAFRVRIYLLKQGKDIKGEEVNQVLQALVDLSSQAFELLRIKDKLTTGEWPIQFILNYWLADYESAVEVQFMMCTPPDDSH